ncbi:hypothetical protein ACFC0P_37910 [Streptomyces broussonetiae]|uniref:hypothetical protein n=1 Tax=Streptomyces broussonetiae TaxID=2686304 RepID=UPI001E32261A|nr:hypothetical protein [Streptomyces broussonetiae]
MSAEADTLCGAEAEQALVPVVATDCLLGVCTRRVEKLTESLDAMPGRMRSSGWTR